MSKEINPRKMSLRQLRDELSVTIDAMQIESDALNDSVPESKIYHVHRKAYANLASDQVTLYQEIGKRIFWRWVKILALIVLAITAIIVFL